MEEKREFERKELQASVEVATDDETMRCQLLNLSEGGALFRVTDTATRPVRAKRGQSVSVEISIEGGRRLTYRGDIARIFAETPEGGCFLAVRFLS